MMEYVNVIVGAIIANADTLRNWAIVVVPVLSWWLAWTTAHSKLKLEAKQHDVHERHMMHSENNEQTETMIKQFNAIMAGYQARVGDLSGEVTALRKEVVSLRIALSRALNQQRKVCAGCDKLPLIYPESLDDFAEPAAEPATN